MAVEQARDYLERLAMASATAVLKHLPEQAVHRQVSLGRWRRDVGHWGHDLVKNLCLAISGPG